MEKLRAIHHKNHAVMLSRLFFIVTICFASEAFAQLRNADFEEWSGASAKMHPSAWQNWGSSDTTRDLFGTYRTDTAQHGQYALKLSRWYSYTMDWVQQIVPVASRPVGIRGYYTYVDNVLSGDHLDTAGVTLCATRWNPASGDRDTLGYIEIDLGPAAEFTPFSGTIPYTSSATPDSLFITIAPSVMRAQGVALNGWGSYLTVDNLSLEASADVATLDCSLLKDPMLEVYDLLGRCVYRGLRSVRPVFPAGGYIERSGAVVKKVVVP